MLCDLCLAETRHPANQLPAEWFNSEMRSIVGNWRLSPLEWRILEVLWKRRERFVSRDSMMALLYDIENDPPEGNTLDVHLSAMRKPLQRMTPFSVLNQWGDGWRLYLRRTAEANGFEYPDKQIARGL